MKILLVAAEAAPLIKTGGLGDAVGGLAGGLKSWGHDVRVILPWYRSKLNGVGALKDWGALDGRIEGRAVRMGLFETILPGTAVPVYLADEPARFDRRGLYGEGDADYPDNLERFSLLAQAALECRDRVKWWPEVIHAHDWHAGLVPAYLAARPADASVRRIFTIHNLAYQGLFDGDRFPVTGLPASWFRPEGLEFWGRVNLLKAGVNFSHHVTTVSPTYRDEILTPEKGMGLDGVLKKAADHGGFTGIINGVEEKEWNPASDPNLPFHYGVENNAGKHKVKQEVLKEFGLLGLLKKPLLVMVTRLTLQKGSDVVAEALPALVKRDISIILLGIGDSDLESAFQKLATQYKHRVKFIRGFNELMAHKLYAAGDFLLMPSRFEPCGIAQLIAFRYGTVPIAHDTGGLHDTVVPAEHGESDGTGILMSCVDPAALLDAVDRALQVWRHAAHWTELVRRIMRMSYSWRDSAKQYLAVYQ